MLPKPTIGTPALLTLLLVCWWAFAFPFLRTSFVNDDFDHLSKARQVLAGGELPDRDFYDDGRPLTIALSVVAQRLNPTLLSELSYRAALLAAGVGVVYLLAFGVSRSILLSVLAALATIAVRPRLYNYPKVFVFPFGLWLLWRYIDRPSRGRLVALTVGTVAAFLFRNDYGVVLAFISVLTILGVQKKEALRPLVTYATLGIAICLPYFVWLAVQGRFSATGAKGLSAMATEAPGLVRAPFRLDLSRGLIYLQPAQTHVVVRWKRDVDESTRQALEDRYGLDMVDMKSDHRSGIYVFNEPTAERIQSLLSDPRVEDTSGMPAPLDGAGWLYALFTVSVPLACFAIFVFPDAWVSHSRAKILSLALLCLLIQQFLILDQIATHLPNVTGPGVVLLAWLVRRSVDGVRSLRGPWAWIAGAVWALAVPAVLLMTWLSVTTLAGTSLEDVLGAGVARPQEFERVIQRAGQRPLDYWSNERSVGMPALIRYVARCLSPDDRLLMVSFAPEVFYLSEHLFAGGVNSYHGNRGFNSSGREILKRLRGQSVPLVIVDHGYDNYARDWAEVSDYVSARYREAAVTSFKGDVPFRILVDSQRKPVRVDPQWNLPCFTDP